MTKAELKKMEKEAFAEMKKLKDEVTTTLTPNPNPNPDPWP